MTFRDTAKRFVAVGVATQLMISTQYISMAQAEMISTDIAIAKQFADTNRAMLLQEIRREDVRAELIEQGVNPEEAEARLAALSDAEVRRMIAQMDEETAGAGVVGTLATVFIILLVTDLLCFTRLFKFTRCIR